MSRAGIGESKTDPNWIGLCFVGAPPEFEREEVSEMSVIGWFSWVVTVIGLWFVATPWVYGFTDRTGMMWNNIILGGVAAILSFIAGWVLVVKPVGLMKQAGQQR